MHIDQINNNDVTSFGFQEQGDVEEEQGDDVEDVFSARMRNLHVNNPQGSKRKRNVVFQGPEENNKRVKLNDIAHHMIEEEQRYCGCTTQEIEEIFSSFFKELSF